MKRQLPRKQLRNFSIEMIRDRLWPGIAQSVTWLDSGWILGREETFSFCRLEKLDLEVSRFPVELVQTEIEAWMCQG
jgi:hypothetical protein